MPLGRCRFGLLCALAVTLGAPGAAVGAKPDEAAGLVAPAVTAAAKPKTWELGLLPAFSASSDLGVGMGIYASIARFAPGHRPYRWRLELQIFGTIQRDVDGSIGVPYQDHWIRLDVPGLLNHRLRLDGRIGLRIHSNAGYFGMGNASQPVPNMATLPDTMVQRHHQYERVSPMGQLAARYAMGGNHWAFAETLIGWNDFDVYQGSRLAVDISSQDPALESLLIGTEPHALWQTTLGWLWDTRDSEFAPTQGSLHEVSVRASPGVVTGARHDYVGLNATARWYRPLLGERLTLATRIMVDSLFGAAPFYELAAHGGLSAKAAIGGGNAIRGVPTARYHGKHKVMGNIELRAKLFPFSVLGQDMNFGVAAFADAGRVWSGIGSASHLDGAGLGLKYGLGGGLRLQWGRTMVVRADVAWSPDADPIGFYLRVNQAF